MPKKRKRGGANWMDTYGDMVTLLLCFFVMLYSMSSVDQEKWQALVLSFNPSALEDMDIPPKFPPNESGEVQSEPIEPGASKIEQDLEKLYLALSEYVEINGFENQISVQKGAGYVFVSFSDVVFFEGDRYELLAKGKTLLDQISVFIADAEQSIREIRILGHTAQARPADPNNPRVDRFLASNRATTVTVYLQEKNVIDPSKLVCVGYGQWRPVSENNDEVGRSQNRRVVMIITGINIGDVSDSDAVKHYFTEPNFIPENSSE